ncbi:MAG: hypothetical protein U9Q12_00685 [Patescibacteria group bacterium]|nr:hypothetical protein [Patescibacteria group bacterium]
MLDRTYPDGGGMSAIIPAGQVRFAPTGKVYKIICLPRCGGQILYPLCERKLSSCQGAGMEKIKNRYFALLALLLTTAGIVNFLSYDTFYKADAAVETIEKIPLNLGKWHGVDVSLEENIYEILETKSIINRVYHTEKGKKSSCRLYIILKLK